MDRGWLEHQYIDLEKSMAQIAIEFGYSNVTIFKWIHTFKISPRNYKEGARVMWGKREPNPFDNLSYEQKHLRMKVIIKEPDRCEICNNSDMKLHLSNKDHKYNEIPKDWQWLCKSCHMKWDYKYNNRRRGKKKL